MMRVEIPEQKIPVDLSSRDEGGTFGTKNSDGPVIKSNVSYKISHQLAQYNNITHLVCIFKLYHLFSGDEGGPCGTKNLGGYLPRCTTLS
jgi:hypothetical protein